MLIHFENYLTFEHIYLWVNFGILPFWLMLIIIPNSKFTIFFVNSIILPLILSSLYIYIIYQIILMDESIFEIFKLYMSLENLSEVFVNETFLLIFWLHFITINIFLGSWISREGVKYNISRIIISIPLILVYLSGPIGLLMYWLIRIFYARRLGFHD
jgi:hypothetical protein